MFGSILKAYKVANISKNLDPNQLSKLEAQGDKDILRNAAEIRSRAEKELWTLVTTDRGLKPLIEKYKVTVDELKGVYESLIRVGAGQWINGQLLCVSIFCFPETLDYLLRHRQDLGLAKIAMRVKRYFETEEEAEREPLDD